MRLIRQGECNRCGECCGGSGKAPPWPASYLNGKLRWKLEDVQAYWPHVELIGVSQAEDGRIVVTTTSGQIRIRGNRYDWEWDDVGWVRPGTNECPLLQLDPGDGTRPCALIGTQYEQYKDASCGDGVQLQGYPQFVYEDDDTFTAYEKLEDWMEEYPSCSYTYEEAE